MSVIIWLALLFEGKAPRSLQRFVVAYLRYSVHVSAYLYLAAGPYPPFGGGEGYPIDLEIEPSSRQSRGRVAARLVLAVPAILLAAAVGGGSWFVNTSCATSRDTGAGWSTGWSVGGLAATAALLAWFASLARGRTPRGLRDLIVYAIGYTAQVVGYLLLVTDRYPTSDPARIVPDTALPPHPVRLELTDRLERSRLTVFFRFLLTIPHLIWLILWSVLAVLAVFVAWLVALVIGRVPLPLHRFIAAWVRYTIHVMAFLFLIGGPFPGFVGAAGSYPVDLAIDPPVRQRRLVTLFRGLSRSPLSFSGGRTRRRSGSRHCSAGGRRSSRGGCRRVCATSVRSGFAIGSVSSYLFLLTDSYPYSAPVVRDREGRTARVCLWRAAGPEPTGIMGIEPD